MECGDTFLMPAPGGLATPHLWIVVTQPEPESQKPEFANVLRQERLAGCPFECGQRLNGVRV